MPIEKQVCSDIIIEKWFWKMNYCYGHKIPPAQSWAWNKAELAFKEFINLQYQPDL